MVVRALTLFRTKLAERDGGSLEVPRFRAHLVKNVPSRAGLATGASNAATALWGANALCGSPASEAELAEWGAELGTEVACSGNTYECCGSKESMWDRNKRRDEAKKDGTNRGHGSTAHG